MTFLTQRGEGPGFRYAGQPVHIPAGDSGRSAGFAAMEITIPGHFAGPVPHAHDEFDEAIYVLSGRLHGHSEIVFRDVRAPASNMLAAEGDGFMIAQARLGPGRVHHAMRAIGMAERALGLMVDRAKSRVAFGKHLSDEGVVRELIAQSRIDIDQARLLVYKTAWLIDKYFYAWARSLRIVDGPDAVHRRSIAREELKRERPFVG